MVDTSYHIALWSKNDAHTPSVSAFHRGLMTQDRTAFFVNVIVRAEFMRKVRKGRLIRSLDANITADPSMEQTYRNILRTRARTKTRQEMLSDHFDELYKYHVKNASTRQVIGAIMGDIWKETEQAEALGNIEYWSAAGSVPWDDLGTMVSTTGMLPTDCMIANFAIHTGMDAILNV